MNNKILDYKIISTDEVKLVESEVRSYLNKGYQPFGNLMMQQADGRTRWVQVVVKYETLSDLFGNAAKNAESFFK